MLGGDEATFRALLQSIVDVARTIFAAQGLVDLPARRGGRRARLRGRLGTRGGDPHRRPLPVEHGDRRLRARHPTAPRRRRSLGRSAVLAPARGVDGLRAERHRRGAAAPRRARARRALGARPARRTALRAGGARAALPVLDAGCDRARPAPACAPCHGRPSAETGTRASSGGSRPSSSTRTPTPAAGCWSRSSALLARLLTTPRCATRRRAGAVDRSVETGAAPLGTGRARRP